MNWGNHLGAQVTCVNKAISSHVLVPVHDKGQHGWVTCYQLLENVYCVRSVFKQLDAIWKKGRLGPLLFHHAEYKGSPKGRRCRSFVEIL